MTVIAYKDGVLASDSGVYANDVFRGRRPKVTKNADGSLCGGTGCTADCASFQEWCAAGRVDAKTSAGTDFTSLLIEPDGAVKIYDRCLYGVELHGHYFALGIGCDLALGAMAHGASAEEAVQIAIDLCDSCRGPVQAVRLDRVEPTASA